MLVRDPLFMERLRECPSRMEFKEWFKREFREQVAETKGKILCNALTLYGRRDELLKSSELV